MGDDASEVTSKDAGRRPLFARGCRAVNRRSIGTSGGAPWGVGLSRQTTRVRGRPTLFWHRCDTQQTTQAHKLHAGFLALTDKEVSG